MERVLITGATGNVGRPLVQALVGRAGVVPVVASRDPAADAERFAGGDFEGQDIELVAFDFAEPSTWREALRGVDRLFLMRPPAISDVATHIAPVVELAAELGVDHIVFLSLLGVEKNPVVPHAKVEAAIVDSGVPYTFLRPSFFMQNLSTTHRDEIRDDGEIAVPAGHGRTSFVDTRDVAEVAALALTDADRHRGQAYDLTGPEALSYAEVAEVFTAVLGKPVRYTNPSPLRFARRERRKGTPWGFIAVMTALYTVCRLGLAARVTDEVEALLGRPPLGLAQFVADHRACWT